MTLVDIFLDSYLLIDFLFFSLAITEDGSVYSCGWGADGQTGLGHYNNCPAFTKIKGEIENEKIVKISSRSDFVLAVNGAFFASIFVY